MLPSGMLSSCGVGPRSNLGPREQDRRLRLGVLASALSLGLAAGLVYSDVALGWRLLLVVPFLWAANFVAMGLLGT